jgi:hypothetical protein
MMAVVTGNMPLELHLRDGSSHSLGQGKNIMDLQFTSKKMLLKSAEMRLVIAVCAMSPMISCFLLDHNGLD